ncbi:transposable element Tcb2 transposase [Trichonephila clavipes]|nr:transposable element Tcb2 transposase [Trichonephila clavipes]
MISSSRNSTEWAIQTTYHTHASSGMGSRVGVSSPRYEWHHLRHWVDHNTLKTVEVVRALEKSAHPCSMKYDACRRQIYRPISKKEQAHHSSAGGKSVSCCLRKADLPKNCCQTFEGRGLYARRPVVCVPLTRQHRTARLQWHREHHNWTEQDWACVLFSDESRFSLSSDCRRQLTWRESGTAYRPENIQEKDRYPTCSIMVWAGIMINGRTRLHVVANGTMTGQRYIDEVLLPHVRLFRGAVGDNFFLWTTTQHVIKHSLFRIV